jgi:hypothetical protein
MLGVSDRTDFSEVLGFGKVLTVYIKDRQTHLLSPWEAGLICR